jgi:WD40 repeat protein
MASILGSSDEKTNGFKLTRLIVDGGTEALRDAFRKFTYPGNLKVVLSRNQHILSRLRSRPKIIIDDQWDKLYPPASNPPNINDFDITLLSVLLRNICGLWPPHDKRWDKTPNVSDHSIEADIVRIKLFRNERFGHIPNTSVSTADFKLFWAEISSPLVRLGIHQSEIDRLENEQCGEEEVERVLKEWNKCETEIMNALEENLDILNEIKDDVKSLKKDEESRPDDVLNKNLVRCNFRTEIELHYEKFTEGTREWVFEQFLTWFNDETSKNRAFVISGLAGMGKSVIAAAICKKFAKHVGASHFFQYNNSQYNNLNIFIQSLAWQLCQVVPAYKEALIQKLSDNLGQSLNNANSEGLFSILFKEPFSGIADPEKRILIVLDAVDESEYHGRHELANLISNHLHTLPSYIRFLITTRPEKNLIDKFKQLNPLYIEPNDERNLFDLKLVLQERISEASARTADLIANLAEKSDGLMLYAFFLSEIYNEESSMFSIDSLPQGIGDYYERYFRRLERELDLLKISEDKFSSLLSALAVAKEPLPEAFLVTLLGLDDSRRTMQKVRKAISSFFVINEDNCISFFHKSVRDWLVDSSEHDYSVDVQDGHKSLFDQCVIRLNKLKQIDVRDVAKSNAAIRYSIKYWITHMLNGPEVLDRKLAYFVSNYAADLEVLFASVCVDVDLTLNNVTSMTNHKMYNDVAENTRATVSRFFYLMRRFSFLLRDYPHTFLQNVVNEGGGELSSKASSLLQKHYKDIIYLEFVKKDIKNDALQTRCLLSGTISGIDISPKHDYVVCCYQEGGIELFSLVSGKSEWKIQQFKVELPFFPSVGIGSPFMLAHCIVFHPHESLILPGRLDQGLTLEGISTTGPFRCDEGCSKFTNCCFSSDNSRMATHYDIILIVWNVLNGTKEICIPCKTLSCFSFTASGKFLGTIDIENVFNVYDVTNDYTVFKSIKIISQFPVEIVSTFKQNSWFCSFQRFITTINHDLSLQTSFCVVWDIILPSNFYCSHELKCFLQHPEKSWSSKIKDILNHNFGWSSYTALRYILIGDKNVLIYSCKSNTMHVFSLEGLVDTEERTPNRKGVFSNISANGDFVYLNNKLAQRFTICELDSNKIKKHLKRLHSDQLDIPVVRDGVVLYGENRTPELWNSDLTQRLASFDQLAGIKRYLSVSDELIACVYQSYVTFFNVFTKEVQSETSFNEDVLSVHACSSKYHVLAQIESSDISLWKDGTKVAGWEDVLRCILFAKFSPQGNRLALSSVEVNKIFIFDVASIKFLAQIPINGPSNLIRLMFFDNKNLVCSSTNHMLYFINVDRGEILTCLDVGDIPAPIAVCRERSIVFAALNCSERFELIKVWLPRN